MSSAGDTVTQNDSGLVCAINNYPANGLDNASVRRRGSSSTGRTGRGTPTRTPGPTPTSGRPRTTLRPGRTTSKAGATRTLVPTTQPRRRPSVTPAAAFARPGDHDDNIDHDQRGGGGSTGWWWRWRTPVAAQPRAPSVRRPHDDPTGDRGLVGPWRRRTAQGARGHDHDESQSRRLDRSTVACATTSTSSHTTATTTTTTTTTTSRGSVGSPGGGGASAPASRTVFADDLATVACTTSTTTTGPVGAGSHAKPGRARPSWPTPTPRHTVRAVVTLRCPSIIVAVVIMVLGGLAWFRWRRRPAEE